MPAGKAPVADPGELPAFGNGRPSRATRGHLDASRLCIRPSYPQNYLIMSAPSANTISDVDTANLGHLLPPSWKADIQRWFAEDTPSFDWAGYVVGEEEQEAILWGKSGVR